MIIGLNGEAGSGKDTCAAYLVENYGFTRYAFADAVREVALAIDPLVPMYDGIQRLSYVVNALGWDRAKREIPEVRRLLQVVGTNGGRMVLGENCWVDIIEARLQQELPARVILTDLRFGNEAEYVHRKSGHVVEIIRPGNPYAIAKNHASEQFTPDADYILHNDDTLESLCTQIDKMMVWVNDLAL